MVWIGFIRLTRFDAGLSVRAMSLLGVTAYKAEPS